MPDDVEVAYKIDTTPAIEWMIETGIDNINFEVEVKTEAIDDTGERTTAEEVTITIELLNITLAANPEEGGEVSGEGVFEPGDEVTVTATASAGYEFVNWTEDDTEVSTEAQYIFTIESGRDLTANFAPLGGVSKFITIDGDDTHYAYDYEALLDSYVAHVMGLPGNELYQHFNGMVGTAALYHAGMGNIDYQDVLEAYVTAVMSGLPFSMDDYIASGQAMPYDITGLEIFEVTVEDGTIVLTPAG